MAVYRVRTRRGDWYVETRMKEIREVLADFHIVEADILEVSVIYPGGLGGAREDIKDCFYGIEKLAKLEAPRIDELTTEEDFHTALEVIAGIKEKADRARDLLFTLEMDQRERH